jgi:hypothetical protein
MNFVVSKLGICFAKKFLMLRVDDKSFLVSKNFEALVSSMHHQQDKTPIPIDICLRNLKEL